MAANNVQQTKNIAGLGGWLILVAISIVFVPFKIAFDTALLYSEILTEGYWDLLTTPDTEYYHVLWKPIFLGEIGFNLMLLTLWLWVAFLFFNKKRQFPKWYIGALLATFVLIILDALAVKLVLPDVPIFDADTGKEVLRTLVSCVIWIPYMLVSKRVKATFIY
ncbi:MULTISPECIES: DUF2569 domain-containing protein [unclassified Psychrobacter]|uniref:DUF2569 domain-containing protein n=1 Tax=unclassified Psychrobacter TaxID=196806 RepID=UPI0018F47C7D|nr:MULTISPECIES: DUF2569 domain-containing protein [unclassified Psychrobacter]